MKKDTIVKLFVNSHGSLGEPRLTVWEPLL